MEISTKPFSFSQSTAALRSAAQDVARGLDAPSADPSLDPEMTQRRTEALRNLFPMLFGWLASRAELAPMHQASEFLAEASNLIDLEQGIRMVEQRRAYVRKSNSNALSRPR